MNANAIEAAVEAAKARSEMNWLTLKLLSGFAVVGVLGILATALLGDWEKK